MHSRTVRTLRSGEPVDRRDHARIGRRTLQHLAIERQERRLLPRSGGEVDCVGAAQSAKHRVARTASSASSGTSRIVESRNSRSMAVSAWVPPRNRRPSDAATSTRKSVGCTNVTSSEITRCTTAAHSRCAGSDAISEAIHTEASMVTAGASPFTGDRATAVRRLRRQAPDAPTLPRASATLRATRLGDGGRRPPWTQLGPRDTGPAVPCRPPTAERARSPPRGRPSPPVALLAFTRRYSSSGSSIVVFIPINFPIFTGIWLSVNRCVRVAAYPACSRGTISYLKTGISAGTPLPAGWPRGCGALPARTALHSFAFVAGARPQTG